MSRLYCVVSALGLVSSFGTARPAMGQVVSKKLAEPRSHGGFFVFAFSPDGKTVAGGTGVVKMTGLGRTSTAGGEVLLWDAQTGRLRSTLGGHGASVEWLAFSRDGSTLASASKDNGMVRLWNMKGHRAGRTIRLGGKYASNSGYFPFLILSPDGGTLVTVVEKAMKVGTHSITEAGELTVWDAATGKAKWTLPDSSLKAVTLSADGKTLAGYVQKVEWKQTEKGARGIHGDSSISLWDAETGKVVQTVKPDRFGPRAIALLPDGETLAGFSSSGLTLCNVHTGEMSRGIKWEGSRTSCDAFRFSADGKTVARADTEWVDLVDVQTGEVKGTLTTKFPDTWWHPAFSPDLKRMACSYKHDPSIIELPWPPEMVLPEEPAERTPRVGPTAAKGLVRTWTDSTGKYRVRAEFVQFAGGQVRLKKTGGELIAVPLGKLSKADQQYVRTHAAEPDTVADIEVRTWTSLDGRFSTDGELVAFEDGKVRLRKANGELITVALGKLSKADQQYVKTHAAEPDTDEKLLTNSIGMKLVLIPAGEFLMGSPDSEEGRRDDEGPQHRVQITKPFYMGVYEVTQEEYERVTGRNPSAFSKTGSRRDEVPGHDTRRFPVEWLSWNAASAFCSKLSELPAEKRAGRKYRLPTEAEWEYACRAGTTTVYHFGDSLSAEEANFGETPTNVGSYKPNAWGLYDMHGNVWEFCADWYDSKYYGRSPSTDPTGPSSGNKRVTRGGAFRGNVSLYRSAVRGSMKPRAMSPSDGFRVVCEH